MMRFIRCFVGALVLCGSSAIAQDFNSLSPIQYEQQLNAILKTRFNEEKDYVRKVVALTTLNRLPRSVVNTSFKWVLNKRPRTNNRFIYFQRVLDLQAERLNLPVPTFDSSFYTVRTRSRR